MLNKCFKLGCEAGIRINRLPSGYDIRRHDMSWGDATVNTRLCFARESTYFDLVQRCSCYWSKRHEYEIHGLKRWWTIGGRTGARWGLASPAPTWDVKTETQTRSRREKQWRKYMLSTLPNCPNRDHTGIVLILSNDGFKWLMRVIMRMVN